MRRLHFLPTLAACALLAATASSAFAHCCHDPLRLGIHQQSEFRRGLHGLDDRDNGLTDESIQAEPPSVGGLQNQRPANEGIGGLGQMRGNSIGNYGAGSLGEAGPGGLGAMRGTGIGERGR